jgi:lysophospholipase L1-like esterase
MRERGSKPGSRMKRFAQKLALLFSTLLLSAAVIEICVRLFYKPMEFTIDAKHYQLEPWPFAFRFLPDQTVFIRIPELEGGGMTVQLNRHGFRGPDIDDVAKRQVRVVSIGDSFTFGWGLQNFADQCVVGFVSDYASRQPGCDIGFSVLAQPGWGSADYLSAYKEFAAETVPDLVVLGFFCGDDIAQVGTVARIRAAVRPVGHRVRPESGHSLATLEWARATVRDSPVLIKLALAVGIRPSGELIRFLRAEPDPMPERWSETLHILANIHDRIRADGGRLVIVSYPSLIQVFAHEQLDDARFDYRRIDAKLEAFCAERGITFIPFLPALVADGRPDLYYPKDRHLTPRGQRLCKDMLVDTLAPILDQIIAKKFKPNRKTSRNQGTL